VVRHHRSFAAVAEQTLLLESVLYPVGNTDFGASCVTCRENALQPFQFATDKKWHFPYLYADFADASPRIRARDLIALRHRHIEGVKCH
jgi:hypothetical protein